MRPPSLGSRTSRRIKSLRSARMSSLSRSRRLDIRSLRQEPGTRNREPGWPQPCSLFLVPCSLSLRPSVDALFVVELEHIPFLNLVELELDTALVAALHLTHVVGE